jgi:hypothetical protein
VDLAEQKHNNLPFWKEKIKRSACHGEKEKGGIRKKESVGA